MIYSKKAICVALACCCLSGTAFAQHVSLTLNNVTVKQAMDALKKTEWLLICFLIRRCRYKEKSIG